MVRLAALAACLALALVWGHNEVALVARDVHPPPLAIGAPAPDFALPGIDGKTYSLASFKDHKVLVVIFTAVHCPTAEVYEARIKTLVTAYTPKDVAFVVIQPNNAKALRLDEMGYTDLGDSLEEMKLRAEHRAVQLPVPLRRRDAGGRRQVRTDRHAARVRVRQPAAAPLPGSRRQQPARGAREGPRRAQRDRCRPGRHAVSVQTTPTVGCSIKWLDKEALHNAEMTKIEAEPIPLEKIGADGIKALRQNATGKTLLVNFWATWCAPCTAEFPELQKIYRMYRKRPFDLVTVSINYPDEEAGVRKFLEGQHASSRNLLSGTMDPYELMGAFDPGWSGGVPYSVVIAPGGQVLYKENGTIDVLKVRRAILAQPPRRRLQGAERLLEQPVNGLVLYCPGLRGA